MDERKLVHLPGTRLSPLVTLQRTLEKIDRVKAVVIVIQWDEGSFDVDWSQMKASEMAMASLVLTKQTTDVIYDQHPDVI